MGMLGTFRSFASVIREISFDEVRDEAETPPRLLVLAGTVTDARRLGVAITGPEGELLVTPRELTAPGTDVDLFDAVVVHDLAQSGTGASVVQRIGSESGEPAIIRYDGIKEPGAEALESLRKRIVARLPERAPAFGRAFPSFRPAAAKAVVDETAKANAQFALVSNIPAVVPVVGSLAAAGADFLVLTKNQAMMIFKLAAIYGRDLGDQFGILQEMVPVVGVGFVWRSVAREAASFIPLAAGTIPKVAIAYAGTLSTGRAAAYYYRTERRPSREQIQGFYQQAAAAFRRLPQPFRGEEPRPKVVESGDIANGSPPPVSPIVDESTAASQENDTVSTVHVER